MAEIPIVAESERDIYRMYERERRLRILRYFNPAMIGVLLLILLALLIPRTQTSDEAIIANSFTSLSTLLASGHRVIGIIFLAMNVVSIALFATGTIFAWRGHVSTSAILATISLINTLGFFTLSSVSIGVQDIRVLMTQTALIGIAVLAFVTLIGELWTIVATTIALSALILGIRAAVMLYIIQPVFLTDNSDFLNQALIEDVAILAGVGLILFFAALTYRQNLQTLGDVRVQYERASQLDELKDQFISSVNHELRSPIMLMHGYINLLNTHGEKITPEKRVELTRYANKAGDNLIALIESILSVRRLDQAAENFEPVALSVREVVTEASVLVDGGAQKVASRDLRLDIPDDMLVWGEQVRLRQIMTNLLSNAVKYSPDGSMVEVSAQMVVEPATKKVGKRDMVQISVRDHGWGIPLDQIPLLFQRFVRLKRDLASTVVGNGLGLYLCRVYAEAMHGKIWVESTGVEGEGSTFFLRLPAPPSTSDEDVSKIALSSPDLTRGGVE